jgi:hypothetical protein
LQNIAVTILLVSFGGLLYTCTQEGKTRKSAKVKWELDCGVAGEVSVLTSNYACMPQALLFSKYIFFKLGIFCTHQQETKMKSAYKDIIVFYKTEGVRRGGGM